MKDLQNTAKKLQNAAFLHLSRFINSPWPHWMITTCIAAASIVVAGLWLTIMHPAAGEIVQNQIISLGLFCASAGTAFFGFVIARGFYLATTEITADMPPALSVSEKLLLTFGVRINFGNKTDALTANTEPDIYPDILIITRPGEPPADFDARFRAALSAASSDGWVLVIRRGDPVGIIYETELSAAYFERDRPPFQAEDWPEEWRIVPPGTRFRGETEADFSAYIFRFMEHYPEWSAKKKITGDGTRAGIVFQNIVRRAASVASAALLFALPLSGQKVAQVLSTPAGNKVSAPCEITYQFERAELYRAGDGKRTYAALLESVPGYRDGGGGKLIAITAGKKIVYRADQAGEVTTRSSAMRPRSETIDPEMVEGFQFPDSLESVEMTERLKYEVFKASQATTTAAKPWWELAMFAYWEWFWLICIITGLSWLFSASFATEGFWSWHRYAKAVLLAVSVFSAGLFATNLILTAKWAGLGPFGLFVITTIIFGIAYFAIIKINPDFRPARGNQPAERGRNDYPRLPG